MVKIIHTDTNICIQSQLHLGKYMYIACTVGNTLSQCVASFWVLGLRPIVKNMNVGLIVVLIALSGVHVWVCASDGI